MQNPELNRLATTYNLTSIEVCCILLYLVLNNKIISYSNTINQKGKAKSVEVLAHRFFNRDSVRQFITDQKNSFIDNTDRKEMAGIDIKPETETKQAKPKETTIENIKDKVAEKFGIIEDVNADNIKQLFINELNNSDNPEKRADLLLKLSSTLELFTPEDQDLQTPTIYLPQRCKNCPKSTV